MKHKKLNKTEKLLKQLKSKPYEPKTAIATGMYIPNLSGDLSQGTVQSLPSNELDPVSKKYVDDNYLTESELDDDYLRLDGTNKMEADLEMDDNAINKCEAIFPTSSLNIKPKATSGNIYYRDSTNQILFHMPTGAGQHAMMFNSNGVCFGRNNPSWPLQVYRATGAVNVQIQTGAASAVAVRLANTQRVWALLNDAVGDFVFYDVSGAVYPFSIEQGTPGSSIRVKNTGIIFNESGSDWDFRIESVNNQDMFKVDANQDRVGINAATPMSTFEVLGSVAAKLEAKTANFTATNAMTYLCDTTTGAIVATLTSATGMAGRIYAFVVNAGGNNLTITPNGTETIDGAATKVLALAVQPRTIIQSDGNNWHTIA